MRLTIVNVSTTIQKPEFQEVVKAIARQVGEDFGPIWSTTAIIRGVTRTIKTKAHIEGIHDALIYVGDQTKDPNGASIKDAFGYHSANYSNIPFGFVYLDVCEKFGEAWSSTLSHEVLELLADPSASLTIAGPNPDKEVPHSVAYDLEVCDPTQGDGYIIDDIAVSNFVTPTYFGKTGVGSKTNFLKLSLAPFGVRPGGYFQFEDGTKVYQVNGEKVTEDRKVGREMLGPYRRNKRRAERAKRAENTR
jgi:hypothetical protein